MKEIVQTDKQIIQTLARTFDRFSESDYHNGYGFKISLCKSSCGKICWPQNSC